MTKHDKIAMVGGGIMGLLLSAFITALMITYVYPFIYNSINKYTNRGDDLKVDYWNAYIMIVVMGLILLSLSIIFLSKK